MLLLHIEPSPNESVPTCRGFEARCGCHESWWQHEGAFGPSGLSRFEHVTTPDWGLGEGIPWPCLHVLHAVLLLAMFTLGITSLNLSYPYPYPKSFTATVGVSLDNMIE